MTPMRRTALSLSLVISSSLAFVHPAAAAEPPSSQPSPQLDPLAEATALYDVGLAQFQVAEYVGALVLWNQAYSGLTPSVTTRAIRATLASNIVLAHQRAYEVSRNPEHLAEGMRLIDNRKAEIAHLYGQDADAVAEVGQLDARRAELATAYSAALARNEVAVALPSGAGLAYTAAQPVQPAAPAPAPVVKLDTLVEADPEFGPKFQQGKALAGGGGALLAIGGVGIITCLALVGTGALLSDIDQDDANSFYKAGGVVGGVGGVLLLGGGVMLGFGVANKNDARDGYRARQGLTAVAPVMLPGGGGLGFAGKF